MIRPLELGDVTDVARLHCSSVHSLLKRLGHRAATAYYRGAATSGLAVGFVYLENGDIRGFVSGAVHPDRLRSGVLRANPVRTVLGVCAGVVQNPANLWWLLQSFRGPDHGSYDASAPELTYLATSEECRGRGIGRRLVEAFNDAMRARGVDAYELSVDENNGAATVFYERLGFKLVGQYREFGTLHRRYRLELDNPTGAPSDEPT